MLHKQKHKHVHMVKSLSGHDKSREETSETAKLPENLAGATIASKLEYSMAENATNLRNKSHDENLKFNGSSSVSENKPPVSNQLCTTNFNLSDTEKTIGIITPPLVYYPVLL